jgi:hypothetical protein
MAGAQQQIDYLAIPCPCEDCRFRQRCGSERLACQRFMMFVDGAGAQRHRASAGKGRLPNFRTLRGREGDARHRGHAQ